MRRIIGLAFNAWFLLVYLAAASAEIKISEVDIVSKVITSETTASYLGEEKLSETSRDVSTITSKKKAGLVTVGADDGFIEVGKILTIPGIGDVVVDATDYELTPLKEGYLFTAPRGVYQLSAIDFVAKTKSKTRIAFGDQPPPPPPPPPPDSVPGDEFDNIGQRVDAAIRALPESADREAYAAEFAKIPTKMLSFEIKRMTEARAEIKALATKWVKYKTANDVIGADGANRLLGWEEAIRYYSAVAVGIRGKVVTKARLGVEYRKVCPGNGQPCYWVEVQQ